MRVILKEEFEKLRAMEVGRGKKISAPKIAAIISTDSRNLAEAYRTLLDNYEVMAEIFSFDEAILSDEIISQNVTLAKQKQLYQDSNRIERKSFRDYARMENALVELNKAVLAKFDSINFNIDKVISDIEITSGDQAIIHLSDAHFNELVDLEDNTYDFEVAGKRLALFASETKRVLGSYGIKKVILAMTGDMINSDRRLDEKLNMATNRMTAAMLATKLLQYFIVDLMSQFAEMDIVYVTGNESRSFEFGFTDMVVTDNYDSIIFNMLELVFTRVEHINFIRSNPVETVIRVNGRNVLLLHGTTLGSAAQGNIQKYVGKYSNKGVNIDYSLFGHIHFCNIGDTFARNGSLVGSNTYSEFGLGLVTKASQNLHIFREDGSIHNHRVELQQIDNVVGYPIQKEVDAYNAKSASKAHRQWKVIEIEESRAAF